MRRILLLFLLLLPLLGWKASGQTQTLELIGQSGGFPNSVTLALDHLFLSRGIYLNSLGFAGNTFTLKGVVEINGEEEPQGLVVSGTTGYFYAGSAVHTVSLADPDNPVMLGSLDLGGTLPINGIAVTGTTLLVSKQNDGLKVVDVSNPASPLLRGTFTANCRDVAIDGGRIFILDGDNGQVNNGSTNVIAVGISNPAAPTEQGRLAVPGAGELVAVGNVVFTAGRGIGRGVRSINVANPAAMALLDSTELSAQTGTFSAGANGLAVSGNRLYVGVGNQLKVYNTASPADIADVGALTFARGRVSAVDVTAGRGVVIADDAIHLLDLANGGTPTIAKSLNEPPLIHDITVDGNRQYVADNKGIYCYEVTSVAASPVLRGFFSSPALDGYCAVAAKGSTAYALRFPGDSLMILDFANPAAPVVRSVIRVADGLFGGDIGVRGNFAYVAAAKAGGVKIINVADPAAPTVVGTYQLPTAQHRAVDVHVPPQGSLIVVMTSESGGTPKELEIVDVSNPAAPVRRARITEGQMHGFTTDGTRLYYGFDSQAPKLKVMDISNPSNPQKVTEFILNTPPIWDMAVVGNALIASIPGGSVHSYFISDSSIIQPGPIIETPESTSMSLFSSENGNALITVTGGFAESEARFTYGSKGKFEITWQDKPDTVEIVTQLTDIPPPLPGTNSLLLPIAGLKISTLQRDTIFLDSLNYVQKGTDDQFLYASKAYLYNGDSLLSTVQITRKNGLVSFPIRISIPGGTSHEFQIYYERNPAADCPLRDRLGNILSEPPSLGVGLPANGHVVSLGDAAQSAVFKIQGDTVSLDYRIPCVENQTSGRIFNTITTALQDSAFVPGSRISVAPGRYAEKVVINQPVQLIAKEGSAKPFVPVVDNEAFAVSTGGTTIRGFIIGQETANPSGIGIKVNPPADTLNYLTEVVIEGNTFQGLGTGVVADRLEYPVITRNLFRGGGLGVHLHHTPRVTLSGNVFQSNTSGVRVEQHINGNFTRNRFLSNDGRVIESLLDSSSMAYFDKQGNPIARADLAGNIFINEFFANGKKQGNGTEEKEGAIPAAADPSATVVLLNGNATLFGNRFSGDSLDAVSVGEAGASLFRENLFLESAGLALRNTDPSLRIDARRNWWGHPSGPGGAGPGSGDEVGEGIDFDDWLEEEVGLVAVAAFDTIFVPRGSEEFLNIYFQNWKNRDDQVDVNVTDDLGWLRKSGSVRMPLLDSLGGELRVDYALPTVPDGTRNIVRFTATSVADGSQRKDSIVLISYSPAMTFLGIFPGDTLRLSKGDSVRFHLAAVDQHDRQVRIGSVSWSGDGGTITPGGLYTAGGTDGLFEVRGRANGFIAKGYVRVGDISSSVDERGVAGEGNSVRLLGLLPNPIGEEGDVRFSMPHAGAVTVTLHDIRGREVLRLPERTVGAGEHKITLNVALLSAGVYYFRLQSTWGTKVMKVVVR